MYEDVLRRIQQKVRRGAYTIELHALDELAQEQLDAYDVEACIQTGWIRARQEDLLTGEPKYIIHGYTTTHDHMEVVAKFDHADDVVIITAYLA